MECSKTCQHVEKDFNYSVKNLLKISKLECDFKSLYKCVVDFNIFFKFYFFIILSKSEL